ncbi:MAG: cytochrome c oxidase subunit II [Burkholderiales bacterium]|nr:cytochrome c oxidase subunit II [Burkholderiales bacterium]
MALLATGIAGANQYNLQPPQSIIAREIYDLHSLIMWIILAIFVVVFGAMTYSIIAHRKSAGHKAEQFHENTTVEIVWTVIPFIILIGMAYPATKTVVSMKDTSNPDITIKATGYQWKWGYDYLQEGVSFYSSLATPRDQIDGGNAEGRKNNPNYLLEVDNPVVVPVGKKVRIITTANDVIHSWWVPALGIKQDAIPGFVRDTWFKVDKAGTYRGQCAELCGKDHGFMPIVVEAVEPEKYAAWVKDQQAKMAKAAVADDPAKSWSLADLKARGEKVYAANCVACHQATGMGVPGAFPALSGSKIVIGPKTDQIAMVLNGKAGTAMQSFKHLNDVEIAAVSTYLRNNWNNNSGEAVTPADVKALRK